MKDYSKFFEYPEVFITDIENTNDKIKPTFRSDTTEYPLTKENVEKLYRRLELQYIKVVQNMNKVVKNKISFPLIMIALILGSGSYLGYSYELEMLSMGLGISGIFSLFCVAVNELIAKPNHKNKLRVYEEFLAHIDEFSKAIEKDPNILSISKESQKVLEQENKLYRNNLVESPININFMDKANLEDLKLMSKRLKIYQELELPVIFIGEKQSKEDVKVKTKTK